MSRRSGFILAMALLLAVGLIASYVLGKLEPYEDVIEHGPSPEVASSPYLAAEHFLRKQGIAARRAEGLEVLDDLPSEGQTLMLLADRGNMTPRQVERVLQWTANGGHLLFIAERLWDEEEGKSGDLLLDLLGIQQYMSDELDDEEASEAPAENEQDEEHEAYPQLTKLYLENEQAPAYIAFDTDFHLYDAQNRAHAWANSEATTHLLQLYHGDGLITVLSDPWIWQNRNINEYDHAWLLWYLSQDSAVTLLYHADSEGLARLLLRHFPLALLVLALLIIAALWHVGVRHGPLQAPASRARRQLEEHLRGSADFLLRRSGQHSLLKGLQQDINRRARRRYPGFEKLAVADQWQVLGRLTRLPAKDISQAMRPLPPQRLSASDFTRQVAHLQTLRNAL
ncbi:DUF4350 domain-containing protein [Ectopseudomonas mendocina]|jgi:hypothetical protein|uniref:DUF4350 domain-containing protein n=2 Tax=Ectopseudomonas mendocina TaxID=300 RepID=A0A379IRW3_ECTME|nr:DUF4350 domain-containing protein [Pseudomonas mendocina]MBL0951011.1 DUF4350 domain-containing protein [Pseudomonas sp.]AEB59676.1 hypothetical protein MDS_3645 [Pseudomonas mendocina NK-01]ALN18313.1 hypothetical protein DW68_006650 [Pseudomonas mendocina S5.2]KES00845.1 hypothetical protein HN51_13610 [Pseudomonas mendocina]QTN46632.1 DUF4350 domain-containing protein [Pseudomonas mendocina]